MSTPVAPSKRTFSPILIEPSCGSSRPATARSSVVLPLPDGPSSDTTSPRLRVRATPLRIGLSPYLRCRFSTVSSAMEILRFDSIAELHAKTQRESQTDEDQHDIDERQRGDDVDGATLPQRHQLRTDHLRAWRKQIYARGVLALENHEHEQPRSDQSVTDQGQRDLARNPAAARTDGSGGFFELSADLHQRRRDEAHAVSEPHDRIGEPHAEDRLAQWRQRGKEQEHPQKREADQQTRHCARHED